MEDPTPIYGVPIDHEMYDQFYFLVKNWNNLDALKGAISDPNVDIKIPAIYNDDHTFIINDGSHVDVVPLVSLCRTDEFFDYLISIGLNILTLDVYNHDKLRVALVLNTEMWCTKGTTQYFPPASVKVFTYFIDKGFSPENKVIHRVMNDSMHTCAYGDHTYKDEHRAPLHDVIISFHNSVGQDFIDTVMPMIDYLSGTLEMSYDEIVIQLKTMHNIMALPHTAKIFDTVKYLRTVTSRDNCEVDYFYKYIKAEKDTPFSVGGYMLECDEATLGVDTIMECVIEWINDVPTLLSAYCLSREVSGHTISNDIFRYFDTYFDANCDKMKADMIAIR
jgi:hypothetical protein